MILDFLKNLQNYHVPHAEKIINFIKTNDCFNLPDGEMTIDGKELFVRIMSYEPKPAHQNKFETHQSYADLQYVVDGIELMQLADSVYLAPLTDYDVKGDYQFFEPAHLSQKNAKLVVTEIVVESGKFAYFYPGEAHKPSCLYQNKKIKVKKLVFKIKIN